MPLDHQNHAMPSYLASVLRGRGSSGPGTCPLITHQPNCHVRNVTPSSTYAVMRMPKTCVCMDSMGERVKSACMVGAGHHLPTYNQHGHRQLACLTFK